MHALCQSSCHDLTALEAPGCRGPARRVHIRHTGMSQEDQAHSYQDLQSSKASIFGLVSPPRLLRRACSIVCVAPVTVQQDRVLGDLLQFGGIHAVHTALQLPHQPF